MADATLDSTGFLLIDNWPKVGNSDWAGPPGIDDLPSQGHHNSATETYRLGTKFRVYQGGGTGVNSGWSTFIYLKMGTADTAVALAAKYSVCGEAPPTSTGARTLLYTVTNDKDSGDMTAGLHAIAISAMTNSYYGWFWCGGVCPESTIAAMAGTYATDGTAVIGGMVCGALTAAVVGFTTDPANSAIQRVAICLAATD